MMRKYPLVCSLIGASVASGIMWSAILIYPTYSGAVALGLGLSCGLALLIIRIRRAFTYASHDLADFVRGKSQPRKANGQFASKREIIHAALRRDVEAK